MNNNFEDESAKLVLPEDFEQMAPKKRNPFIVQMVNEEIRKQGLEGRLVFHPMECAAIPNRKKYYVKSGVSIFEAYMYMLNTLPLSFLEVEIGIIVNDAKRHFRMA